MASGIRGLGMGEEGCRVTRMGGDGYAKIDTGAGDA